MSEYRKRPVYAVATTEYTVGLDIITLHTEYAEALATWNAVRIGMIWEFEGRIEAVTRDCSHIPADQMGGHLLRDYHEQIEFLSCEDPDEIDCKYSATPIIMELLLEEPIPESDWWF